MEVWYSFIWRVGRWFLIRKPISLLPRIVILNIYYFTKIVYNNEQRPIIGEMIMAKDDKSGREKGVDPKTDPKPKIPIPKPRAPEPQEVLKTTEPPKIKTQ